MMIVESVRATGGGTSQPSDLGARQGDGKEGAAVVVCHKTSQIESVLETGGSGMRQPIDQTGTQGDGNKESCSRVWK